MLRAYLLPTYLSAGQTTVLYEGTRNGWKRERRKQLPALARVGIHRVFLAITKADGTTKHATDSATEYARRKRTQSELSRLSDSDGLGI